jgi:hypothetical protein
MSKHYIQAIAEDRGFKVTLTAAGCLGVFVTSGLHQDAVGMFAGKVLANAANMTDAELAQFGAALASVKREFHGNRVLLQFPGVPFDSNVETHTRF